MIYGFWTCKLGGTGTVELSRGHEIESMELCKLPGWRERWCTVFFFAIHIEATRMALLTPILALDICFRNAMAVVVPRHCSVSVTYWAEIVSCIIYSLNRPCQRD